MPTPVTSATPYCTPTQLLSYVDWEIVADSLRDGNGPRPLRASILNASSRYGALLQTHCMAASGELESACLARELYSPDDLAALTGATAAHLQKVVAGLTLLQLFGRRMPISGRPEDIPAVKAANDALALIADGKRIFGLAAQRDAGAGMTPITRDDVADSDPPPLSSRAYRYFGDRQPRQCF